MPLIIVIYINRTATITLDNNKILKIETLFLISANQFYINNLLLI